MLKISKAAVIEFSTRGSRKSAPSKSRNKEPQYVNIKGSKYRYEDNATQKSANSITSTMKKTSARIAEMNLRDWLEYEQRYTNLIRRDLSIR